MDYTKLIADLNHADELTADHRILALTDRAAGALEELTKPKHTDYTELVKALRCKRDDCEGCDIAFIDNDEGWICQYAAKDDDAAAAIEALLKENKELIEDGPEMVEADGHWEWRKPNGEVLMPKRGEWINHKDEHQCSVCRETVVVDEIRWEQIGAYDYCPNCGAKMGGTE